MEVGEFRLLFVLHLDPLFSSKNYPILDFLVGQRILSLTCGFRHNLSNRKTTKLPLFFLCLMGAVLGREEVMFVFGVPTRVKVIRVSSYSICCWIPSPLRSLFSMCFGGLTFTRKFRFFFWHVLLGWMNTVDKLVRRRTFGSFCCLLCRKANKNLDHLFWNC